ncbi:MAG TPA: EamA family transporter [Desulfatiglandales bacterium]|nr:EamA family transporter [Desulfatiglandales bacterium]
MKLIRYQQTKTYLALCAAMVFWGLSFVATKIALEGFSTFTLIFGRFALASCLFAGILAYRGFPSFNRREHGRVFLVALFDPGLYFIFETVGLQHTTAPKAALIIATIPVAVTILAAFLLRERPSPIHLLGVGLSLAGIAVLVAGDPQLNWKLGGPIIGDLLIFGAVISAALYIVNARNLGRNRSALEITSVQVIYGAIFYTPAFFWELPLMDWSEVSGHSVGAFIYLTLFATIGAFLCYNYALAKVPASRAAVFINGIPVVTAAASWLLLGEKLTLIQAGGGVLVLFAVFVTNFPTLWGAPKNWVGLLLNSRARGVRDSSILS